MQPYLRPTEIGAALDHLAAGARVLAGGTDLYPALEGAVLRGPLLDVTALPELQGLKFGVQGVRIGAAARWSEIATAPLPPSMAALAEAARQVGGRQIQNAGTIGGNLCNASPAADGTPPLLVLEAEVELRSAAGVRRLPLEKFLLGPRRTALAPGELMVAVHLPAPALQGASSFLKLGARATLVISIAMAAARITVSNGRIAGAALALGACGPVAVRLGAVEAALIGAPAAEAAARIDPAAVAAALAPIDDVRATAAYRAEAGAELIARLVRQLAEPVA